MNITGGNAGGPSLQLGQLFSDQSRELVRALQNQVIRKMPAPPEAALALLQGADQVRRSYLAQGEEVEHPYSSRTDIWFRHRDQEDLDGWWSLRAELMPEALTEVDSRFVNPTP
jgi:hypothetical protein